MASFSKGFSGNKLSSSIKIFDFQQEFNVYKSFVWFCFFFLGGGFCQNLCVATHFHTVSSDLRTIYQGEYTFLISTLLEKIF